MHQWDDIIRWLVDLPAIVALMVGSIGALLTTRWVATRLLGFPEFLRYRILAVLPVLMLVIMFLPRAYHPLRSHFEEDIYLAFGFTFALANIRIPSRYSRGLGIAFAVLYGWEIYAVIVRG